MRRSGNIAWLSLALHRWHWKAPRRQPGWSQLSWALAQGYAHLCPMGGEHCVLAFQPTPGICGCFQGICHGGLGNTAGASAQPPLGHYPCAEVKYFWGAVSLELKTPSVASPLAQETLSHVPGQPQPCSGLRVSHFQLSPCSAPCSRVLEHRRSSGVSQLCQPRHVTAWLGTRFGQR